MEPTITITTERNPRQPSSNIEVGHGSDSSSSSDVRPALRHTEEYAAAFDLEVWKAQQQARFRAQLRQAKEKLEKRVYAELTSRDRRRLDELEHTRKELEDMALRLEAAGEALQKRQAQLEARECAFEARRVRVAEQHEAHLCRVEQKAKRAVEEAAVAQDSLKAQLQEKDAALRQVQERLRAAESEYDILQRRTARFFAEKEESSSAALQRETEERLAKADKTIQLLRSQLREQTDRVDRLGQERDTLFEQQHHTHMQLHEVSRDRDRLAKQCEWCEAKLLRQERKADTLGASSPSPPQRKQPGKRTGQPTLSSGKDDLLARLLRDLKQDIAEHVSGGSREAYRPPSSAQVGVLCEAGGSPPRQPTRSALHAKDRDGKGHAPTNTDPYLVVEEMGGVRPPDTRAHDCIPPCDGDGIDDDNGNDGAVAAPPEAVPGHLPRQLADANLSTESTSSYCRVEVASWHRSETAADDAQGEILGRASTLPPLAPPSSNEARDVASDISPSPEDFAQAASVSSHDAATTRAEMEGFVHQMKLNREKLLETGVYSPSHPVVKEMTEKISLYEQYLARS